MRIDRKRFIPEDRGRIVTAFLQSYFPRYVEYDFTAHLEDELDEISDGKIDWRQVLREFWKAFSAAVGETKDLRVSEVLDKLDEELGPPFLPGQRQWRQEPARLPVLRQRPARPEARQVRRLHRLLELSGVPASRASSASSMPRGCGTRAPTSTDRSCSAWIR